MSDEEKLKETLLRAGIAKIESGEDDTIRVTYLDGTHIEFQNVEVDVRFNLRQYSWM